MAAERTDTGGGDSTAKRSGRVAAQRSCPPRPQQQKPQPLHCLDVMLGGRRRVAAALCYWNDRSVSAS